MICECKKPVLSTNHSNIRRSENLGLLISLIFYVNTTKIADCYRVTSIEGIRLVRCNVSKPPMLTYSLTIDICLETTFEVCDLFRRYI